MIISEKLLNDIINALSKIPYKWDAREVYLHWKNTNSPYLRQTEWIGWRFQELCEQYLTPCEKFDFSRLRYGYADFDAFAEIPWDFKAHVRQNPRGLQTYKVPGTDRRATFQAIKDYKAVGFILGIGDAVFNDESRSFQRWHDKLKGGLSDYKKREYLVEHPLVCVKPHLLNRKFGLLKLMKNYVRTLGLLWKDLEIKMGVHVKQK
jgi:hypothetical protein